MASRFWRGGTGTWDASDTTHWATSSGGAGGASVPGSSDTVTLDGSSGGGTVTVNTTVTVQSITCGAFTGTLDFSVNNNNVTLSVTGATAFSASGAGTRTLRLGNGTWSLPNSNATVWDIGTTTNLTFNANSSVISFAAASSTNGRTFSGGGLTYNTLTIAATTLGAHIETINGLNTFSTLTVGGGNYVAIGAAQSIATLNLNGTTSAIVVFVSSGAGTSRTITSSTATTLTSVAFRSITGAGAASFNATNSFDLGNNSGMTITAIPIGPSRARADSGF